MVIFSEIESESINFADIKRKNSIPFGNPVMNEKDWTNKTVEIYIANNFLRVIILETIAEERLMN